jgi:hypothetical protein
MRKLLCVWKTTNLVVLYGELERYSMAIQCKFNLIKYWIKILKSADNTLIK